MSPRRAAAALVLLVAAARGAAYERSTSETGAPLAWGSSLVPYFTNPDHPYTCPPGAGGDPALAAVRASFGAWRPSCPTGGAPGLELVDAGPLDDIRIGMAGSSENLVVFRQGWCRERLAADTPCLNDEDPASCNGIHNCYEDATDVDRQTLALTSVLYYPDSGRIVDADIEMNGWDGAPGDLDGSGAPVHGWYFTCEEPGPPPCATYGQAGCVYADLRSTLTHEVGHFIGLRHVCDGGGAGDAGLPSCGAGDYAGITMYPFARVGEIGMRSLSPDDVAGVCAIYPRSDGDGDGGGGCGCGAGEAPGAVALAVLVVAALWPRRRRART